MAPEATGEETRQAGDPQDPATVTAPAASERTSPVAAVPDGPDLDAFVSDVDTEVDSGMESDGPQSTPQSVIDLTRPGVRCVRVPDPAGVAAQLTEEVDVVLPDHVEDPVRVRVGLVRRRREMAQALVIHDQLGSEGSDPRRVVCDTAALRSLADALARAERLTTQSAAKVRARFEDVAIGRGVSLHPETVKSAAAELRGAAAAVESLEGELDQLRSDLEMAAVGGDLWADDSVLDGADQFAPDEDFEGWPERTRGPLMFSSSLVILAFAVGAGVLVAGAPIYVAGLLPAVAGAVFAFGRPTVEVEQVDEAAAAASDHLAAVGAMADLAYGGEADLDDRDAVEADDAARDRIAPVEARLVSARDRLRAARSHWANLVGADADPEDLDSVLRLRDAQFGVSPESLARTPTLRAADAHLRRLQARWGIAWEALGLTPPDPNEAGGRIAALEAKGIRDVAVDGWNPPAVDAQTRAVATSICDEILAGTPPVQARAGLRQSLLPIVVVADGDDDVEPDASMAEIAGETAIVVLKPVG